MEGARATRRGEGDDDDAGGHEGGPAGFILLVVVVDKRAYNVSGEGGALYKESKCRLAVKRALSCVGLTPRGQRPPAGAGRERGGSGAGGRLPLSQLFLSTCSAASSMRAAALFDWGGEERRSKKQGGECERACKPRPRIESRHLLVRVHAATSNPSQSSAQTAGPHSPSSSSTSVMPAVYRSLPKSSISCCGCVVFCWGWDRGRQKDWSASALATAPPSCSAACTHTWQSSELRSCASTLLPGEPAPAAVVAAAGPCRPARRRRCRCRSRHRRRRQAGARPSSPLVSKASCRCRSSAAAAATGCRCLVTISFARA